MAFEDPITIQEAIKHVRRDEYVLPAIQREFIWKTDQITRLFDSLMRGYPIGSFLFWKVASGHYDVFRFYGFLDNYHERDRHHNPPIDLTGDEGVTAILDGHQRLTSLHIGLRGSYAFKTKHKRRNNPDAFPQRRLYLNLLQPASNEEVEHKYDFRFLTDTGAQNVDGKHWFPVGDVLSFDDPYDVIQYLREHDLLKPKYPQECLSKLYKAICEKKLINYYQEEDQDINKVLNIFIRVNSGGTKLSHSDLLLSIATALWDNLDARKEIHDLVDDLNRIGEGFSLSKDFVLKSCLVLADISDIGFKVKNFTRKNTKKIEGAWHQISDALRDAVCLASRFGYNRRTLSSNNVLVPIAYYLLTRQPEGYLERQVHADDREAVRKWIARALLKTGTFGGSSDTTLRAARSAIQGHSGSFPIQQLDIAAKIRFVEEDLDDLLDKTYGNRVTFSVLALLYPGVGLANRFQEDHFFPKAFFTKKRLLDAGVSEDQVSAFLERRDRIANLQLLEATQNQEKSAKMPTEWMRSHFTSDDTLNRWKERSFVDDIDIPDDMREFLDFYEARRKKMKARLAQDLGVNLHG